MAHFAFIAPPLAGHVNPSMALAAELVARGHRATYFGFRSVEHLVRRASVAFHPLGRQDVDLAKRDLDLARAASPMGMRAVIAEMARETEALCWTLPHALADAGVDAVVSDQLSAAGGLVAQHLRLPYVTLANALLINRDPIVPPFFTGWQPDASPWKRRSIRGAEDVYDLIMRPHGRVVSHMASEWGLGDKRGCVDCLSTRADIAQIPRAFDFPREAPPPQLEYVGPIRPALADTEAALSARLAQAVASDRPLVFASFGTLFGARFDLFRAIGLACRELDLELVVAHGGRLSLAQVDALSELATVEPFVPQRELLRHAAICVTHAGMNTTMDAMEAGVPALAIPMAFDQQAIAARVTFHGLGIAVPPRRATVRRLHDALETLLDDQSYADAARAMGQEIRAAGGRSRAADMVVAACFGESGQPD